MAQPAKSDSIEAPNKRAKVSTGENETPQPSAAAENAEPAASAAPFSGGFGGLASKGASGFAFGGASTFGSGFGSVAFAGTFGSTVAGGNSFASKASKDGGDKGSPSVVSNAGSAAAAPIFAPAVFAANSEAGATSERPVQVFGTSAATPRAHLPLSLSDREVSSFCTSCAAGAFVWTPCVSEFELFVGSTAQSRCEHS